MAEQDDDEKLEEQYWIEYFSELEFGASIQDSINSDHGVEDYDVRYVFESRPFGFVFHKTNYTIQAIEEGAQARKLRVRKGLVIISVNGEKPSYKNIKNTKCPVTLDCQFSPAMKLLSACLSGDIGVVKKLLRVGLNPNGVVQHWKTPLIAASTFGNLDIVKLLLRSNAGHEPADPNIANPDGQTSVMYSALNGYDEVVGLLVEHRADLNVADLNGYTALMMAAESGLEETYQLLLDKGAQTDLKNDFRQTAGTIVEAFKNRELKEQEIRTQLEQSGRHSWEYYSNNEWKRFDDLKNTEIEQKYRINQIEKRSGKLYYDGGSVRRLNFGSHYTPEPTELDEKMSSSPTDHVGGVGNVMVLIFCHDEINNCRYVLTQKRRESATMFAAGCLSFPSGRVEPGEDFKQAAIREVFEESRVALDPSCLRFLSKKVYEMGEIRRFYCIIDDIFIGRGSHVHENAHFGHFGHQWMSRHQIEDVPSTPSTNSRKTSEDWISIKNRQGRKTNIPIEGKLFFLPSDTFNIKKAIRLGLFGGRKSEVLPPFLDE